MSDQADFTAKVDEEQPSAIRPGALTHFSAALAELRSGVVSRHWELVESALHRLHLWHGSVLGATHAETADPEEMRKAQEDADQRANEVPTAALDKAESAV